MQASSIVVHVLKLSLRVQGMQEVMVEHGMRIACVASFNPASFHTLTTSNMETRQHVGQIPVEKWRNVAVSLLACCPTQPYCIAYIW